MCSATGKGQKLLVALSAFSLPPQPLFNYLSQRPIRSLELLCSVAAVKLVLFTLLFFPLQSQLLLWQILAGVVVVVPYHVTLFISHRRL